MMAKSEYGFAMVKTSLKNAVEIHDATVGRFLRQTDVLFYVEMSGAAYLKKID